MPTALGAMSAQRFPIEFRDALQRVEGVDIPGSPFSDSRAACGSDATTILCSVKLAFSATPGGMRKQAFSA
jgi:hypothetical protein